MNEQEDSTISEITETQEQNFECDLSINAKLSEDNKLVSNEKDVVSRNPAVVSQISEENAFHLESNGFESQNQTNSFQPNFSDENETLIKCNFTGKKKVQMRGKVFEKARSRQQKLEIENFKKITQNDSSLNERKGGTSHSKLIKGNVNLKKNLSRMTISNKVNFQPKSKKHEELEHNWSKNDCKDESSVTKQFSSQNIVNTSEAIIALSENPDFASNDTKSKQLLDYGFRHLKEELKSLIHQCVEKEDIIESLEKRLKDLNQSYSETKKKCLHLEQKNEKLSKHLEETAKSHDKSVQDLNAANSFIFEAKQAKKIADNIVLDLEKRLKQTLAQNERLTAKLDEINLGGKNAQISIQKQIEELTASNKLLSRQKSELREVVIKQMQLVKNLKRQILHLKATLAQNYTEQEVMKVIDDFY